VKAEAAKRGEEEAGMSEMNRKESKSENDVEFEMECQCNHTHLSEKCWLSECPCQAFKPLTDLMRKERVRLNEINAVPD